MPLAQLQSLLHAFPYGDTQQITVSGSHASGVEQEMAMSCAPVGQMFSADTHNGGIVCKRLWCWFLIGLLLEQYQSCVPGHTLIRVAVTSRIG